MPIRKFSECGDGVARAIGLDQGVLNNVTLVIMVHHAYDPQNSLLSVSLSTLAPDEASEFNKLSSSLNQGEPVVLGLRHVVIFPKLHAVVAWADKKLPNGNYSIAISDPDAHWNANADINGDNLIDIYDAIILANRFNQHYP